MSQPNWGRLKQQGRVKDVGIPWSDDERAALDAGVPADYVRRGALEVADYEKMLAADNKVLEKDGALPVEAMSTAQLQAKAFDLGIDFTPGAPDEALRQLITAKEADQKPARKTASRKTARKTAAKKASK